MASVTEGRHLCNDLLPSLIRGLNKNERLSAGRIRMAHEDAGDVKIILVACGFVEPRPDGSIALRADGWFESCLVPKHIVAALGLFARVRRWEQLRFDGHRAAGMPSADELLTYIGKQLRSQRATRQLTLWHALRWQVYRDHVAWLSDAELIVRRDSAEAPEIDVNAIADFLISTSLNTPKQTEIDHGDSQTSARPWPAVPAR